MNIEKFVEGLHVYLEKQFAPIIVRVKALEQAPAVVGLAGPAGPAGPAGAPGVNGLDGKDGAPSAPGASGAVGLAGKDGEAGPPGDKGKDGKSVSLDKVKELLESMQSAWALDFERRAQGILQSAIDKMPIAKDGRDGKDGLPGVKGADGFSLDDFDVALDEDGKTVIFSFRSGDSKTIKKLFFAVPLDKGVYQENPDKTYQKGDGVTFGGSWWIAQINDPQGKPGQSPDWRLAVKKGRDLK